MSRITRIQTQTNPDRLNIFIDDNFCCGVRKRTFEGMNLSVGSEITCEELKEKESLYWKHNYNADAWKKEKVRLNRIRELIEKARPDLTVLTTGFGADSLELIKEHPEEKGIPDLNVVRKDDQEHVVLKIEVTGTEIMRGKGYWVRPDKLEYAKNHPTEVIYTALHYAEPTEIIRFLKHNHSKQYIIIEKEIKGAREYYCEFYDEDDEILTFEQFIDEIKDLK